MIHHFLWLDLETTGLDPVRGSILEAAAVLVNDSRDGDMSVVDSFTSVVQPFFDHLPEMDPFVLSMHTSNGLLADIEAHRGRPIEEVEDSLIELARRVSDKPRSVVLAGSTVAFDQGFVRVHMPRLAELLSHRCFDVSTLKMAERDWAGEKFKKAEAHRALPDVLESLEHCKEIRALVPRWNP
jgi:oligoribonuclease